ELFVLSLERWQVDQATEEVADRPRRRGHGLLQRRHRGERDTAETRQRPVLTLAIVERDDRERDGDQDDDQEPRASGVLPGDHGGYRREGLTKTRCNTSNSSRHLPEPSTTACSGASAILTGMPVSCRNRLSKPRRSAPPPVRTMPRSMMSAESSGGV